MVSDWTKEGGAWFRGEEGARNKTRFVDYTLFIF